MSDKQPFRAPVTAPPTCQPGVTNPWPIGGSVVCRPISADAVHGNKGTVLDITTTFTLPSGFMFNEAVTMPLLYVVNGSLDYSALFSQMEVSRCGTITFAKDATEASISILTLPIPPNSTFELEILAYPGLAGTIISGPVQAVEEAAEEEAAEDKGLKALSVLATTALVTALGALAFALLRSKD